MNLTERLRGSMDSEYIQNNDEEIINLLSEAADEIENLKHSPIIGTLCPMWKEEARNKAIKEFARDLINAIEINRLEAVEVIIAEIKELVKEKVGDNNG